MAPNQMTTQRLKNLAIKLFLESNSMSLKRATETCKMASTICKESIPQQNYGILTFPQYSLILRKVYHVDWSTITSTYESTFSYQ